MTRPRLLDLFSCAGGCSDGYAAAGFDPFGVDLDGAHPVRCGFCPRSSVRVVFYDGTRHECVWCHRAADET